MHEEQAARSHNAAGMSPRWQPETGCRVASIVMRNFVASLRVGCRALAVLLLACAMPAAWAAKPPNILFVIMDDVGIDQMQLFGYGGETPPATPTIDRIGHSGIRFGNAWAMPACSTSRAALFTGRYPLRTNVYGALGPDDLANAMLSPYEMTVPRLLKQKGYMSALFGKFHMGLQGNSPFGLAMPASLGWDYYSGWLDETGDPSSIDTTAGGAAPAGRSYSCGFVPSAANGGADVGACYFADGACMPMATINGIPPGRTCRDNGGLLDPNGSCARARPGNLDFNLLSGHYVSPLVINDANGRVESIPPTDKRARTFRGSLPVDDAIAWIRQQPAGTPWMATLSFASAHTPLMQPPVKLVGAAAAATTDLDCGNAVQQRVLQNQMIEALDLEFGRLLVTLGLAQRDADGRLIYNPDATDTMIVVIGDNGTLGGTVKLPFDYTRAKGTAYQTGVWVPMVVSGPLVRMPDRAVTSMVNLVDLYQLFGEIAGIDVAAATPRTIDAVPMLPYLASDTQRPLRKWNFTQVGINAQANGSLNGPCQISSTCTQIPVTKGVCEDNGGIWWGKGATDPVTAGIPADGMKYCCDVNVWQANHGKDTYTIQPLDSKGIRNDHYKIVANYTLDWDSATNACFPNPTVEFYEINEAVPKPMLDEDGDDLLPKGLTPIQQVNYDFLASELNALLRSQPTCWGDGNIDGVVNGLDLVEWSAYASVDGKSSWYDFNQDGLTNEVDLAIVQRFLGTTCPN
jgi:arylsulfatase A-like enzyme